MYESGVILSARVGVSEDFLLWLIEISCVYFWPYFLFVEFLR